MASVFLLEHLCVSEQKQPPTTI